MVSVTALVESGITALGKFEPLIEKTVIIKSEAIHNAVGALAEKVGQDGDTVLYILLMLVAYPLAAVVKALPSKELKHASFGLGGIAMMQLMFGSQWIHSFFTAMVTYAMAAFLPRKIMPLTVFIFVMGYMCLAHMYRQYTDWMGWSLDFTGPQMILCIKLSSFAYNLYDSEIGTPKAERKVLKLEEQNQGGAKDRQLKALRRTVASQKKYAIHRLPSVMEYLGYIFCFTTIMAGPAFEYADYVAAVDGSAFAHHTKKDGGGGAKARPASAGAALARLGLGLGCMALHVALSGLFPLPGVIAEPEFLARPMASKAAYVWMSLFAIRFKYYFAWKVAEGSGIMAGFGFEGYTDAGAVKGWGGTSNMDILGFELSGCVSENSRAWNQRTQGWLERYVYNRTNRSLFAVYFVSSIWHGFYPGYYMFFLSVPLATAAARITKEKLRPYFAGSAGTLALYNLAAKVLTSLSLNYLVTSFQLLAWGTSFAFWKSFGFCGHIALALVYVFCTILPKKKSNVKKD